MVAEFYGIGVVQDPGPRPFIKAAGLRKVYVQELVEVQNLDITGRTYAMGRLAQRAVEFFHSQPWEIQWHTMEFRVVGNGQHPDVEGSELWRWEVWVI